MTIRIIPKRTTSPGAILAAILFLSVLLRLAAALYLGNSVEILPGTYDQLSYHHLALRLINGHGFTFGEPWWPLTPPGAPTAHWSFLYTFYLAAVYKLFGPDPLLPRLIQALIVGLLHPFLVYRIGRLVFNQAVGLAAALLTALYAYFIYYAATLMTEPFYITAILAALYLTISLVEGQDKVSWRHGFLLGLTLGAAVLLRQLLILFIPFLFLWLCYACYRRRGQIPWFTTLAAAAIVALMILPFTAYNYARFQRFVLLNTNAGYAFFWANHPVYGTRFEPILPAEMGSYQELVPPELRALDEAALDQALLQRGLAFVVDDPGRYLLLSLSRIPPYVTFWPQADSGIISNVARVASFGLLWPFMLYGLLAAFRREGLRQRLAHPTSLLVLFAGVYSGIHVLSWTLIRYRLPVDAVLLLFAGLALVHLRAWLQERSSDAHSVPATGR